MRVWVCSTQERFFRAVRQVIQGRYPLTRFRFIEGSPIRMIDDVGWGLAPPHLIVIDERMKGWDSEVGRELCYHIVRQGLSLSIAHIDSNLSIKREEYTQYRLKVHENEDFLMISFEVVETYHATWDQALLRFVGHTADVAASQEPTTGVPNFSVN
jgi:hypothetical protein